MLKQLQKELMITMKSGKKAELMCLRNIIGKLKSAQIDKGEVLTEEESSKILKSFAKQLKDSIAQYKKGGRQELAEKEGLEISKLLFVGNDLNDLEVMKYSGYSACPSDSHRSIIEIADFELKKKGGEGVVREIIEDILGIDSSTKLY